MRVLHINKTDTGGGAAVAALRIHRALLNEGVDSHVLVQTQKRSTENVTALGRGLAHTAKSFYRFAKERALFLPYEKERALRYYFSMANTGVDITDHPEVRKADIINLHWINQGMLSLDNLKALFELKKPIVWTLHDMWPFTGGCHYAGNCLEFNEHCGFCPLLRNPSAEDLSTQIYQIKKDIYHHVNINIVTCSHWLGTLAKSSSLFRNMPVNPIPNPINIDLYNLMDRANCRRDLGLPLDKKLILFGAANVGDIRKGFRYLSEAVNILQESFPEMSKNIDLVVFGKMGYGWNDSIAFKVHEMKYVRNPKTLVKIYNAADTFVLPSLQDNLPNTVVECLACGTPVVGFRIAGVPEMIRHGENGYLAEVKNSLSLADGIYNMLFLDTNRENRARIREMSIDPYSQKNVAQQYIKVYKEAIDRNY